jgi:hypothetical protein
MRHLISGELTNYRVVRTSPEPLQKAMERRWIELRLGVGDLGDGKNTWREVRGIDACRAMTYHMEKPYSSLP